MNNPLGVSPSKGNQGTTRGKEKYFDLGGIRIANVVWRAGYLSIGEYGGLWTRDPV